MPMMLMTLVLGIGLFIGQSSSADENAKAEQYVHGLFKSFQSIFADDTVDIDQSFLDYYDQNFDNKRISLNILGNWARRASKEQRAEFARILPKHLCRQVGPQIDKYFSSNDENAKVEILSVQELKKKRVKVDARYVGLQEAQVEVYLNPHEENYRIFDVKIADISMILAQRDQISQMIRDNGNDIDAFLSVLEEKSLPACIKQS